MPRVTIRPYYFSQWNGASYDQFYIDEKGHKRLVYTDSPEDEIQIIVNIADPIHTNKIVEQLVIILRNLFHLTVEAKKSIFVIALIDLGYKAEINKEGKVEISL